MNVTIKTDINRERDILSLCKSVLNIDVHFWDNPKSRCPFCNAVQWSDNVSMAELKHAQDCAYTIAKDLTTGLL